MDTPDDIYDILEDMVCDEIGDPLKLRLNLLQDITDNFSEKNLIGRGGYGEVYKGHLGTAHVAVKKLYSAHAIEDETFNREVDCLMKIRHHNIVWFVGYCADTQVEVVPQGVKNIFAETREKLLCFKYLRNGSLSKHLTGEPCALQWRLCYQIIKGICLGLNYLHERHIVHLDLKPDNILLDDGMVPKIADFGLSRLLNEERSRMITRNIRGTRGYMAPEYIDRGEITVKSDTYSLGVIIRHMVKGRNTEATSDQDVLVSWTTRFIKDSSQMKEMNLGIGYQQIKACIEISQRCTQPKPQDRPSMQDILCMLEETEAAGRQSVIGSTPNGRLKLAKFGPWGGAEGKPRDVKIAPYRLDSVAISSGVVIDSIQFSYTDYDGQYHTIDPWGGYGGDSNSFHLGPSEFLIGVSGSIGSFKGFKKVITSLTFVTNACSYGPFGRARGTPFHVQVQSDGCIVGFFGHSRRYLEAIGVYTDQNARVTSNGPQRGDGGVHHDSIVKLHNPDHNGQQCTAGSSGTAGCGGSAHKLELFKFGPWGGDGGESKDIKIPPYRLDSITIRSGVIIDSIEFSYTDHDGLYHTTGPWGGHGGSSNTFKLGPSEFLTGVSGSIGKFNTLVNVITSLTFVTNARSYGPFGKGRGPHFHIPMQSNGCIVGFFGRAGQYLNAIGVYTNDEMERIGHEEPGIARIGPWGADQGVLHDITVTPHHLERVTIFSETTIDSLEFLYSDHDGKQHTAGPWGGCGGSGRKISFDPSEYIVKVSGTFCAWNGVKKVLSSLTLVTNTGRSYGPYGTEFGTAFHVPEQSNSRIVGFFAHGEDYIEAIGAYVRTL